jgi:hypothetical protein
MSLDPDYTLDVTLGIRAEMQQLYRLDDRSPWKEFVPDKTATDVEANSYGQECAIIVRREPHPITNQVALHSITIQSPLLKKVLDSTFKGFKGLNPAETADLQSSFSSLLLSMASFREALRGRAAPGN